MAPSTSSGTAARPGLHRGRKPLGEIRIVHALHVEPFERGLDLVALMPRHHDHRPGARGQRLLGRDADERPAADLGQKLVRPAHAGRAAGGEDDGCDPLRLLRLGLGARLRPRHDFHQQPADAKAGDVLARHRQAREQPHQDPVEAVFLRRARAAGRAEHRLAARLPDQHQIAGIDRHAEMLDLAADRLDRRRDHVAAVGDGGSAEHHDQLGAFLEHLIDRLGDRALLVRHAALGDDAGAGRRQPRLRHPQGLLDHLGGKARQQRRHHADLLDLVGRDANERLAAAASAAFSEASLVANGMIFTVAIISPSTTGLNAGSVANVIASSTRLSRSMASLSTTSTPAFRRTGWRGR